MVECNVCGWAGEEFRGLFDDRNVLCPGCGAYERHRAFVAYLERMDLPGSAGRVLEVGNGLVRAFRIYFEDRGWSYIALDLWPGFGDILGDVGHLPLPDRCFDLVLSFHVLEHVEDDRAALSELSRVVTPAGLVAIQVPYDDARFATTENEIAPNATMAARYYYDHKRDYGLDIAERCSAFWEHVAEIHPLQSVPEPTALRHGFARNHGTTFLCRHEPPPGEYPGLLRRDLRPLQRREMIAVRAYALSLDRNGNGDGGPVGDWIRAEAEIGGLSDEEIRMLVRSRWAHRRRERARC